MEEVRIDIPGEEPKRQLITGCDIFKLFHDDNLESCLSFLLPKDNDSDDIKSLKKELHAIFLEKLHIGEIRLDDTGEVSTVMNHSRNSLLFKEAKGRHGYQKAMLLYLFSQTDAFISSVSGDLKNLSSIIDAKYLSTGRNFDPSITRGFWYSGTYTDELYTKDVVPIIERDILVANDTEYRIAHTFCKKVMLGDRVILSDKRGRNAHIVLVGEEDGYYSISIDVGSGLQSKGFASLLYKEMLSLVLRFGGKGIISYDDKLLEKDITNHIREKYLITEKRDVESTYYTGIQGIYSSLFRENILVEDFLNFNSQSKFSISKEVEEPFYEEDPRSVIEKGGIPGTELSPLGYTEKKNDDECKLYANLELVYETGEPLMENIIQHIKGHEIYSDIWE